MPSAIERPYVVGNLGKLYAEETGQSISGQLDDDEPEGQPAEHVETGGDDRMRGHGPALEAFYASSMKKKRKTACKKEVVGPVPKG
jgi:hypothetical protein